MTMKSKEYAAIASFALFWIALHSWLGAPAFGLFGIGFVASMFSRTFFSLSIVFILMAAGFGFIAGLPPS